MNLVAEKLSGTIRLLDIPDQVKQRVQMKRLMTRAETDILANEMEELKKRTEEQKRRQLEAKRKSELLDELFGSANSKALRLE